MFTAFISGFEFGTFVFFAVHFILFVNRRLNEKFPVKIAEPVQPVEVQPVKVAAKTMTTDHTLVIKLEETKESESLESLKLKAKDLKIRGWNFYKSSEKLLEAIQKAEGGETT